MTRPRVELNLLAPHLRERPMLYVEAATLFGVTTTRIKQLVTAHRLPKIRRRVGKHPRVHIGLPPETIQALKALLWGQTLPR